MASGCPWMPPVSPCSSAACTTVMRSSRRLPAREAIPASSSATCVVSRVDASGSGSTPAIWARSVMKLLVTRGSALGRGYALSGRERPMRILLRYAWPAEDPVAQEEGVRVRRASLRLGENPALAGIKHCNRLEQILARREWTDADIADALMFSSSGALVSGTMSNVFLVRGSKILTPRIDRCGVAGEMRELVLELAAAAAMAAEERRLDAADLETADEIFLTN